MLNLEAHNVAVETQKRLAEFFATTARNSSRALLLDYDGTLAPSSEDPEQAVPYPAVAALLDQIQRASSTRLVIVTGRGAREAASLLDLRGVEVWGLHGLERLHANGRHEIAKFDEQALQMVLEAKRLMIEDGLGDLLEFKQVSVAVYWRGIEAAAKQLTYRVERIWRTLRRRDGLELMKFDGGMEIRVSGRNKGSAVRAILAEMGRHAAIAYLGDDYTDEDAFAALQGYGLSVLVRHAYRPTVADVWIRPPEGVTAFLSEWVTMCGGAS